MKLPSNITQFKHYCRTVVSYSAIAAFSITPAISYSIPQGGIVSDGAANFTRSGNDLTITQMTDKAVIDWQSFDVGTNESTRFAQPNANAIALNRIHDLKPSQIDGKLTANGNVMLVNPNGVVFGKNSAVDVNGMVVTTSDIDNKDFLNGKFRFNKPGNPDGKIVNNGVITVKPGGKLALVAPSVENNGTINAKLGKVELGGADAFTIDMDGDGLITYDVSHSLKDKSVTHNGTINAEGGTVSITTAAADTMIDSMINIKGNIDVSSKAGKGGKVNVRAGTHSAAGKNGTVIVNGKIDASGDTGGTVHLLGDQVALDGTANVIATGNRGGGEVLVGGDYMGGGNTQKARKVHMGKDTLIDVSATQSGNGGKAILWSDEYTNFLGQIKATGGALFGNGGFIETSSKEILTALGNANASAPNGNAGNWLLDPNDIFIITGADGANTNITVTAGPPKLFDDNGMNAIVTTGSIEAALNGGTSVTVETGVPGGQDGNITIANNISKTAGGAATLLLKAADSIFMNNAQITSTSGALNVILHADKDNSGFGTIYLYNGSAINSNGGDITLGGGLNPALNPARYSTLSSKWNGAWLDNASLNAQGGNISIRGIGGGNIATSQDGVLIGNGSVVQTNGTGNITINGTGGAGGNNSSGFYAWGAGTRVETENGAINITGAGGATGVSGNMGISMSNSAVIAQTGSTPGTNNITLNGTSAGSGDGSDGINIQGVGTKITSINGDINLTGNSIGDQNNNHGVVVHSGAAIESTGNTTDAANITITGNGSNGGGMAGFNHSGIIITSAGTKISAVNGAITFTGVAGNANRDNYGIKISSGAHVEQTGTDAVTGAITMDGTGNGGGGNNPGVLVDGLGTLVTSYSGDIGLTGISNAAANADDFGVGITNQAVVSSSGTNSSAAKINVTGTASSNSTTNGFGILMSGTVTSIAGDVNVTGIGQGPGGWNFGVFMQDNSKIESTGAANVKLTGTGGAGSQDIKTQFSGLTDGITAASGNVEVNANSLSLSNSNVYSTTGTTTIQARTNATDIFVGAGGAGLNISDANLALFQGGNLTIGNDSAGSGAMAINTAYNFGHTTTFATGTGLITPTALPATTGSGSFIFSGPTSLGINLDTSASGGQIRFNDPLTLTADISLTTGGGGITFGGTVDGTTNEQELLTLTAGSGNVAFNGTVGQGVALQGLGATTTGSVTSTGGINVGTGTATISGSTVNLGGTLQAQTINLTGTTSVTAAINGTNVTVTSPLITLSGTVNGATGQAAANQIVTPGAGLPNNMRLFNGQSIGFIATSTAPTIVIPNMNLVPEPAVTTPNIPSVIVPPSALAPTIAPGGTFNPQFAMLPPALIEIISDIQTMASVTDSVAREAVVEIKNTYYGISTGELNKYAPSQYLWDLYRYTKDALTKFNLAEAGVKTNSN